MFIPKMYISEVLLKVIEPDPVVIGSYGGERVTRSGRVLPPSKEFIDLERSFTKRYYEKSSNREECTSQLTGFLGRLYNYERNSL